MRALVTGGAGFIGSHLVDALVARDAEVLVVDDLSTGRVENLNAAMAGGVELAELSIGDREALHRCLEEFAPERVFHLAAQVDVRRAVAEPGFDAAINVLGSINLLEGARLLPGASVVLASTGGAIYGEGARRELPFPETAEAAPEAAYGASKLSSEVYLGLYRRLYGLPGVAMRFGNVYGPRQDPHGEAGVVAIFCGLLLEGRPLRVFGDGAQTRDYVFVSDVVDSLLRAADRLAASGAELAGPYNVGTGVEVDVNELAAELMAIAGADGEIDHQPERMGEVRRVAIDPMAAERDLGWRAVTALTDGLRATYESIAAGPDPAG